MVETAAVELLFFGFRASSFYHTKERFSWDFALWDKRRFVTLICIRHDIRIRFGRLR